MDSYTLAGEPVSKGIGIGEIYVYEEYGFDINRSNVQDDLIEREISKLDSAIKKTLEEIDDLKASFQKRLEKDEWFIFDAFKSMLEDQYFIEEVKEILSHNKLYAENAVDTCIQGYIKAIQLSENEYAQQSIHDLNDISTRIIKNIIGESKSTAILEKANEKHIVLVRNLNLTLSASLGKRRVAGIVYEQGAGYLSHAAIVLRGLGIPSLSGIKFDGAKSFEKSLAVLDGDNGKILINPDKEQLKEYKSLLRDESRMSFLTFWKNKSRVTKDGARIGILASVGSLEECDTASSKNFDGIGLVRTEVVFAQNKSFPDETEQYGIYNKIVKKMGRRPVIIRTADIGGDKQFEFSNSFDYKNSQDYRGIKYTLANSDFFYTQLRAIVRAGANGNLGIAFPMVDCVEEVREAKRLISKVKQKLSEEGRPVREKIRIGAFIETRQGADNLESILREVNFISIGTNDLLNQVMGIDRKESTYEQGEFLHPKFLRLLKHCIDKARKNNKSVSICGEMISNRSSLALLLGLGANEFSVNPSKRDEISEFIQKQRLADLKKVAESALVCRTIEEVEALAAEYLNQLE